MTDVTTAVKMSKPTFETLPREIRNNIYDLCLVFDGEIVPYPHRHEVSPKRHNKKSRVPQSSIVGVKEILGLHYGESSTFGDEKDRGTGLLLVNHQISDEAAAIFCGKNTFRMSRRPFHDDTFRNASNVWDKWMPYFKRVKLVFDGRDIDTSMLIGTAIFEARRRKEKRGDLMGRQLTYNEKDFTRFVHKEKLNEMKMCCTDKIHSLRGMWKLQSLILDFENLVCPSGCCRDKMVRHVRNCWIKHLDWILDAEPTDKEGNLIDVSTPLLGAGVTVVGLWDSREISAFQGAWYSDCGLHILSSEGIMAAGLAAHGS